VDLPSRCTTNSHTASRAVLVFVSCYCWVGSRSRISMYVPEEDAPWIYQAGVAVAP